MSRPNGGSQSEKKGKTTKPFPSEPCWATAPAVRAALRDARLADFPEADPKQEREVLRSARRAIEAELDQAGAATGTLTIEAVDEIGRSGTGAKQKLVSASA
jgi:hypothetical protein